jgi:hypothetical protein
VTFLNLHKQWELRDLASKDQTYFRVTTADGTFVTVPKDVAYKAAEALWTDRYIVTLPLTKLNKGSQQATNILDFSSKCRKRMAPQALSAARLPENSSQNQTTPLKRNK